jgi:endonuclease/exonuclease/phosphatase family metal-dependent hydrolase
MTRHPRIVVRAVTWNLFHGRDFPPNPKLFTRRSRLLRITERDDTHVQVNRPLRSEFTRVLGRVEWDLALLQEAPPRWRAALAKELGAESAMTLTSRNYLRPLQGLLADLNPDLIASSEGGSNQLLVRAPWRIEEVREHTLTRRPERRRMLWARLGGPDGAMLAVANLHGSVDTVPSGSDEVLRAAERAVEWAGDLPLLFGGDLNLRPSRQPEAFEQLARRFDLTPPTGHHAIDHLLARGLDVVEAPRQAAPEEREVDLGEGRALRPSDHGYVTAAVGMR